jgi:hypothetical protein
MTLFGVAPSWGDPSMAILFDLLEHHLETFVQFPRIRPSCGQGAAKFDVKRGRYGAHCRALQHWTTKNQAGQEPPAIAVSRSGRICNLRFESRDMVNGSLRPVTDQRPVHSHFNCYTARVGCRLGSDPIAQPFRLPNTLHLFFAGQKGRDPIQKTELSIPGRINVGVRQ